MNVYINKHVQEQFDNRTRTQEDITLEQKSSMRVLVQREKNGKKIDVLKGCIRLENGLYLIVNIYKHIKTKKLTMKALTVLTNKQLRLSRNFGKGNQLKNYFNVKTENVILEDKFFDYNTYIDYFKEVEWSESDVTSLNF